MLLWKDVRFKQNMYKCIFPVKTVNTKSKKLKHFIMQKMNSVGKFENCKS